MVACRYDDAVSFSLNSQGLYIEYHKRGLSWI